MQHNESDMHRNDISPHHGDMLGERFTSEQVGSASEQIGDISGRASNTSREKTFTNVFQRLNRRLLHLARGILGNEMEAEDAMQESFCRMWERREQMGSEGEVAAMITTTVKNVSIDTLHRQSHTGMIDIDEVAETPKHRRGRNQRSLRTIPPHRGTDRKRTFTYSTPRAQTPRI